MAKFVRSKNKCVNRIDYQWPIVATVRGSESHSSHGARVGNDAVVATKHEATLPLRPLPRSEPSVRVCVLIHNPSAAFFAP